MNMNPVSGVMSLVLPAFLALGAAPAALAGVKPVVNLIDVKSVSSAPGKFPTVNYFVQQTSPTLTLTKVAATETFKCKVNGGSEVTVPPADTPKWQIEPGVPQGRVAVFDALAKLNPGPGATLVCTYSIGLGVSDPNFDPGVMYKEGGITYTTAGGRPGCHATPGKPCVSTGTPSGGSTPKPIKIHQ